MYPTENSNLPSEKIENYELSEQDLENVSGGRWYCVTIRSYYRTSSCLQFTRSRVRNANDLA